MARDFPGVTENNRMTLSRRGILHSALAIGMAGTSSGLKADGGTTPFRHGVASGEPGPDRMLLWTRLTVARPTVGQWIIASDPGLRTIVGRGRYEAGPERDYTVKVMVAGLKPGRDYWYRFEAEGEYSPIGRTRTLPIGAVRDLHIATACCAMYLIGYFHAYRAIAELPRLDAILFLGDYIYEFGKSHYASLGTLRMPDPPHDTLTLDDYRRRFAQSRAEADLQAAHARAPWICIWDDHEIADDDWMHGAAGHKPERDGDFEARKAAAVQAWYEWMPVYDPAPGNPYGINRSVRFGDLATLIIPETRLQSRQQRLNLATDVDFITDAAGRRVPDRTGFRKKLADPSRTMIGERQLAWVGEEMMQAAEQKQPWVLLGSSTVMADYDYPDMRKWAPASGALAPFFEATGLELPILNLDSWSGYAAERDKIYAHIRRSGVRTVVLSGDSHMAWVNRLHDALGPVALELSSSTLTGPALGDVLALRDTPFAPLLTERNRDVQWCDPTAIGFILVHVTRDAIDARFVAVSDPRAPLSEIKVARHVTTEKLSDGTNDWREVLSD